MEKERITRRDFAKAALLGTSAFLTIKAAERIWPYIPISAENDSSADYIAQRIEAGSLIIRENPYDNSPEKFLKVTPNKLAFANALKLVSEHFSQESVHEKLISVISKVPITIALSNESHQEIVDGKKIQIAGRYFPIFKGGPKIIFYEYFLDGYNLGKNRGGGPTMQKANDKSVYHELVHFFQDITDPLNMFGDMMSVTNQKTKNIYDVPIETSADELSNNIVNLLDQKWRDKENPLWPFGNFFNFENE